jgi:hypothetical protein
MSTVDVMSGVVDSEDFKQNEGGEKNNEEHNKRNLHLNLISKLIRKILTLFNHFIDIYQNPF